MLKSWKFWLVMVALGAVTGLFVYGFTTDPRHVPSPLVGRPTPPFSITELNTGAPLTLADLEGTPFVLNFWASWCVPCREEARVLEATHRRWGGDPRAFRVVGISVQDTPEAARQFAKRFGKTYFLGMDGAAGEISLNYGLYGVPETFFVDARGIIRYKHTGAATLELMNEHVPPLLASARKGG